jgi:putative transposase
MEWKQLLASITSSVDEELRLRNAYLMAENCILRRQITGRVRLTDAERKTLAELGQQLGRKALAEVAAIAQPDTILAWHRTFAAQKVDPSKPRPSVGRPRIDKEIEDLVVRMARENRSWGYDRIVGALTNLGYHISDQTVGNILKRHGVPPAPERKKTTTWREFVHIHMHILMATDFFTAEVWSWCRLVFVFLLLLCLPFSRCKVQIVGMATSLNTRCAVWYVDAARWVRWVREQALSRLLPLRTHVQPLVLVEFAPYHHQKRFPRGMGKVRVLSVRDYRRIRDGPLRKPPWRGGLLLHNDDRAAA